MNDKVFHYGITIGLIISLLGFILMKIDLITENYTSIFHTIYKLTLALSVIFILTKSAFIKEKFNQILKLIGFTFLLILGINLLKELEFNFYEIEYIRIISCIFFGSLLVIYTSHFNKKKDKNHLDYLKIGFLILLLIGGFLKLFNLLPNNFEYISRGLFWVVVIGMLYINYENQNGIKKHVD